MQRQKLILAISILCLAIIITACDNSNEDSGLDAPDFSANPTLNATLVIATPTPLSFTDTSSNVAVQSTEITPSVMAQLPAPTENSFVLPNNDNLSGTIILARGVGLYAARFDGQPPIELAAYANFTTVSPSNNGRYVAVFTRRSFRSYVSIIDLATLEVRDVMRVSGDLGGISWSSNDEWLLINSFQIGSGFDVYLLNLEEALGSTSEVNPPLVTDNAFITPYWLQDNTILTVDVNVQFLNDGGVTFADNTMRLSQYNPDTQTLNLRTELEFDPNGNIDIATLASDFPDLIPITYNPFIYTNGIFSNPTTQQAYQFVLIPSEASLAICNQAQIQASIPTSTTIYQIDNTLLLSDLQTRPSASDQLTFLRWYLPDCETRLSTENLRIDLMLWTPNAEAKVLSSDIYPGDSVALSFLRAQNGQKYAFSPDGQYILWVGGNISERESTLHIVDLTTNETKPILLERGSNDYVATQAYHAVYWSPIE